MKKNIIFAALAGALVINVAYANKAAPTIRATPYIGISVGVMKSALNARINAWNTIVKVHRHTSNHVGSIFAGIGAIHKDLYGGVEVNAKTLRFKGLFNHHSTYKDLSYGFSLRAGILINPSTLLYAGLGGQTYHFYISPPNDKVRHYKKMFFEPSIGIDKAISKNVNIGFKVSHAVGQKFSFPFSIVNGTLRTNKTSAEARLLFQW